MSVPARALLFLVRVYQAFFSGMMPSACKFYPSCSHYAADAVRIHGARRGSWLAFRRVLRCHPFTRGGVDFVPEADAYHSQARRGLALDSCPATQVEDQRLKPNLFQTVDGTAEEAVPSNAHARIAIPRGRGSVIAHKETAQTDVCATEEAHS